jgi:flagellar hook-length control protein FliK
VQAAVPQSEPDPFAEVAAAPPAPVTQVAPRPAANGAQAGMPQVATTPKDVDAELAELGNLWT